MAIHLKRYEAVPGIAYDIEVTDYGMFEAYGPDKERVADDTDLVQLESILLNKAKAAAASAKSKIRLPYVKVMDDGQVQEAVRVYAYAIHSNGNLMLEWPDGSKKQDVIWGRPFHKNVDDASLHRVNVLHEQIHAAKAELRKILGVPLMSSDVKKDIRNSLKLELEG